MERSIIVSMWGSGVRAVLRMSAVSVTLGLVALALTGCTGDDAAGNFRRSFANDPAVASLKLTSHDNQSFSGGVSGDVIVKDTLPDDEVLALAARIGDYTSENNEEMKGRLTLVADGLECRIEGGQGPDRECLSVLLSLRADDRVVSGKIGLSSLSVIASSFDDGLALAADLPEALDVLVPGRAWATSIHTDDRALNLYRLDVGRSSALVSSWNLIAAELPLTGVSSDADRGITFALASESDLSRASDLAEQTLADTDVPFRFSSDRIRLGNSDGRLARQLLADLDGAVSAGVESIWEGDSQLRVVAKSKSDLSELVLPVLASVPAGVTSLGLAAADDGNTRVDLRPGIVPTEAWFLSLDVVLDNTEVVSFLLSERSVNLRIGAVKDDDLGRFAPDLKTLAPAGSRVCVVRIDDAVCVTADDSIDEGLLNRHSRERGQAFIKAWNAT